MNQRSVLQSRERDGGRRMEKGITNGLFCRLVVVNKGYQCPGVFPCKSCLKEVPDTRFNNRFLLRSTTTIIHLEG